MASPLNLNPAEIAVGLADLEQFLAGQPVVIPVKPEDFVVAGFTVEIALVAGGVSIVKK